MSSLISLNSNGLSRFGKAMRAATAETRATLQAGLKSVAAEAATDARSSASWSTRIPGSIRSGATRTTAYVRAGGTKAPHAPAFENHGRPGSFRHPVFGRQTWVEQDARPFLAGAVTRRVDSGGVAIAEAIRKTIEEA